MSYRTLIDLNLLLLEGYAGEQHPFLSELLARTGHVGEKPVQAVNAVSPRSTKGKLSFLLKGSRLRNHCDESSSESKGLAVRSLPRRENLPQDNAGSLHHERYRAAKNPKPVRQIVPLGISY